MPTAVIITIAAGFATNAAWSVFNFLARKAASQVETQLKDIIHTEVEALKTHMEAKYYDRELIDERHKNFDQRLKALELHRKHA